MVDRLVANVAILLVLGGAPATVSAAACAVPPVAITVKYDVYSELNQLPPANTAARDVINDEMLAAENIFLAGNLKLDLVDATRPNPATLTVDQADLIRNMLHQLGGDDPEAAIDEFKEAAKGSFYNELILNIYYVDVKVSGMHFRLRDGTSHNFIVIGNLKQDETLAHEMGHAFSLEHANFWSHNDPDLCQDLTRPCGEGTTNNPKRYPNEVRVEYCAEHGYFDNECQFERDNVMWAEAEGRDAVSKAQAKRAACNENSTLVKNGDRNTGGIELMDCPDWSKEKPCEEIY